MDFVQCIGPSRWYHEGEINRIDTTTLPSNSSQRRYRAEDDFEFENEVAENDETE